MRNKPIIFLLVIVLALAAFLSGYFFSQKDFSIKREDNSGNILEKFSAKKASSIQDKGVLSLGVREALSPVLSEDKESILFYEKGTGRVFQIDLSNKKEVAVSEGALPNLIETSWSPNISEVISLFYGSNENTYRYYNYKTGRSQSINPNIESLAFSPKGDKILYFAAKNGSSGFYISNPDGLIFKEILASRLEYAQVFWPTDETLAFITPDTDGTYSLYTLSKEGEIKLILEEQESLDIKWSPDGSKLLFSSRESGALNLSVLDLPINEVTSLETATSARKCVWDDNTSVVCGVAKTSSLDEEIYSIDLAGTKKLLESSKTHLAVQEIFIANNYLVIHNSLDNRLYLLKNQR